MAKIKWKKRNAAYFLVDTVWNIHVSTRKGVTLYLLFCGSNWIGSCQKLESAKQVAELLTYG